MRKPLVAGNWKLNKTAAEAYSLVADMLPGLRNVHGVDVVLCPPFTALYAVSKLIKDHAIFLGGQNMFWEEKGAFTGEISARMLAEFCQYVILGHSERRQLFGESNEHVAQKMRAALSQNLIPILCVGETLEDNEAGRAAGVVSRQVHEALHLLDTQAIGNVIIAYEPVWAIGTGRAATSEGANTIIRNVIRPTVAGLAGETTAQNTRVLYGGSVDAGNARDFFIQPEIDGALVGGASLIARSFVSIVEAAAAAG